MPIQFIADTGVTLTSVGVSLRSTAGVMSWSGESLLGVGVSLSSGSMVTSTSTGVAYPALKFDDNRNSMYVPMMPF